MRNESMEYIWMDEWKSAGLNGKCGYDELKPWGHEWMKI